MNLTVSDVVELMGDAVVQTGEASLQTQPVEWVSVIETPVENFVRENELVLTTGIGCGEDEERFLQFVHDIAASNAAALAIAMGRFVKHIPDRVLHYASTHGLILLEIPWELRFADLIQSVLLQMEQRKQKEIEQAESLRKQLLEMILNGTTFHQIAEHVSHVFDAPILLLDRRGVIRGKSENSDQLERIWHSSFSHEVIAYQPSVHASSGSSKWLHDDESAALQLVIRSAGEIQGYLLIGTASEEHTLEQQMALFEHVTTAVALHFLHEHAAKETEWRLQGDFVWSLAKGDVSSWDTALSRAKSLGYQVHLPYLCLTAMPENISQLYQQDREQIGTFDHWLQGVTRCLEEEAYDVAKSLHLQVMATYAKEYLIVFLEVVQDRSTETAYTYIQSFQQRMNLLFPHLFFSWGISKTSGYKQFHESFEEARKALTVGRKQRGPGCQSLYADTRIDRVLFSLIDNQELREMTDSLLHSLLVYSVDRKIDLVKTFQTYHRNKSNVSQTARQLNLHRQSLLYRLRKIESLTGCSLNNPDDVFLLDLSIRLWQAGIFDGS